MTKDLPVSPTSCWGRQLLTPQTRSCSIRHARGRQRLQRAFAQPFQRPLQQWDTPHTPPHSVQHDLRLGAHITRCPNHPVWRQHQCHDRRGGGSRPEGSASVAALARGRGYRPRCRRPVHDACQPLRRSDAHAAAVWLGRRVGWSAALSLLLWIPLRADPRFRPRAARWRQGSPGVLWHAPAPAPATAPAPTRGLPHRAQAVAVVLTSVLNACIPLAAASPAVVFALRAASGLTQAATFPTCYQLLSVWACPSENARVIAVLHLWLAQP